MAAGPSLPSEKSRPLQSSRRLSHYEELRIPTLGRSGDVYVGDLDRHGIGSDINSWRQHGVRGGSNDRTLDFELAFAGFPAAHRYDYDSYDCDCGNSAHVCFLPLRWGAYALLRQPSRQKNSGQLLAG